MLTGTTSTSTLTACRHCGLLHVGPCPRVKAVEYYPDGTIKRVEYFSPADYAAPIAPEPRITWTLKPND